MILRLRGRTTLGATFFFVVSDYAERLRQVGGRFYLSGVSEDLLDQMRKAHVLEEVDGLEVVPSEPTIGASTRAAYERAQHWLEHDDDAPS